MNRKADIAIVTSATTAEAAIVNPWPRPGLHRSSGERPDIEYQQNQEDSQSMSRQGGRQSSIDNRQSSIPGPDLACIDSVMEVQT